MLGIKYSILNSVSNIVSSASTHVSTGRRVSIVSTDHNLWDIIVDGDLQEEAAPAGEQSSPPAPKTAKQLTAKRNQERVKSILLLAIPDEYLLKFHNVPDSKSLWVAIKSRFGGNDEYKKMQRNVLKHQLENFTTSLNKSLDKVYDRVYEDEMKRSLSSTSNSQNLVFLPSKNTSSTNEVSPARGNKFIKIRFSSTLGADEMSIAQLTVRVQNDHSRRTGRNLDFKGKQPVTQ
ncbi:hypothetical protein Tco_0114863 [Tanacetum coccineum]